MKQSRAFIRMPIAPLVVALAAWAVAAPAATLTWDADGTTTGSITDGGGAWLGASQWWDGTSNVGWTAGDDAVFGAGGTGGAVTLSATTAATSLAFNTFSGTYTLGTSGQVLTLGSGGLTMNAGAGAVTLVSPVTLSAAQSWTNNASSLLTASAAITNGGFGLTVAGSGNTTLSGVISGVGSLMKTGAGTLTLGNVQNSFTGGTVVNGGTLTLGTGADNGNIRGSLTINAGATVNANAGGWSLGYGGTRSGATYAGNSVTSIAINGGLLNITSGQLGAGLAANSIVLTGGTIGGSSFGWINSNTLTPTLQTLASSARSTLSGGISLRLSTSGTLTFDVASGSTADGLDLVVSGAIVNVGSGDNNGGSLTKTGAGRMVLFGSNTFTGGLTLSSGQLDLNNASALGTGTVTITGGSIGNSSGSQITLTTNNAQLWNADVAFVGPNILNLGTGTATLNASRTVTVSAAELIVGSVSGAGFGLTKAGAGKLSLSGSSGYTGPTDVTSGTLQFGIGGTTGALSPSSTITGSAGSTLFFARSNTVTQGVDFAGVIGGALNVTQGVSGTLVLNGANTYTGTTRIAAGTLSIGNTLALQNSTLDLNSADTGALAFGVSGTNTYVVGGLIGSRSLTLSNTVVLSVGGNGSSGTYSGVISGSGGLVKTGGGTLTLGNVNNSFTGGTIVNGGTLTLGNGGQNGNIRGSLTINQGATVNADANAWSLGYGGTRAGAQFSGNSVTSIAINGGLLNITTPVLGAGLSANTIVLTGGTIGGGSFGWYNTNTLTPVLQTLASSTRSTLSGGISLRLSTSGTLTFDVASGSTADGLDLVVSGAIVNAGSADNNGGSLAKTGAGTLLLSGLNTFTGGVTVTGGTLAVQSTNGVSGALPANTNLTITNATVTTTGTQPNALSSGQTSGVITINSGGLLFAGNSAVNAHNIFNVVLAGGTMASGTGSLGTALANWYVLGGITATGSTTSTISASLGKTGATNSALAVTVDPGSTLAVSGPIVNIVGANGLTKSGSGLLVLSGTNTFSGGLTLSAGQLDVNSATALGAGTFTIAGGTIGNSSGAAITHTNNVAQAWNADVTFVGPSSLNLGTGGVTMGAGRTVTVSTGTLTVGGVISGGTFALTKAGAGTLTLTGVNTFTGGTIVDGGTLTLGSAGFDGVIRGSLAINAGDTVNASQTWALGAGGTNSSSPSSRSVTDVTINGGTLNFTTAPTKGGMSPTTLTMTGGSITGDDFQWYYGNSSSVSLVTQPSSTTSTVTPGLVLRLNKTAGAGVLTLDVASGTAPGGVDLLISGQIRNATEEGAGGRLVKTGAGTLVLSGNNAFTDGLTLSAGQVNVNTATALGTGAFTIAGGTIGNSSGNAVALSTNNTQAWNGDFTFAGPNSLTLGSGAVALGASRTVTVSTGTLTVNGVISGSGFALTKTGAGTLSIGNVVNTYSGGTVVDGGTLTLGGLGVSGNNGVIRGSLTINQGATVNADAKGWSLGYGGTRSGAAFTGNSVTSIAINGGLLNFTNPESGAGLAANSIALTGGTIGGASFGWIESNTLTPVLQTLASSTRSTLVGGISLRLTASGTLTFDVASGSTADGLDLLVSGPITDSTGSGGRLVKTGAGTLVLAGTNTFAGAIALESGTLRIAEAGVLGSGNYGGNIAVAAAATFDYATSANQTLSGVISGSGGLVKTGAGTLTLTNANTFTGGVVVTGGTLAAQGANALRPNQNISISNATLTTIGTQFNALNQTWTSGTTTINAGGMLYAGNTSSNAHNLFDVVLAGGTMGSGTGTLNGAFANWYVNGGITATGSTTSTISASLGKVAANSALAITVDAGSALTVSGPVVNISGANGLTKTGAGLLTLSATNTYTGVTTVSAGTLALSGGWAGTLARVTVANVAGTNAALAIQSGSYGLGANGIFVGNAATSVGSVSQTGGVVTFTGGEQLLVGSGGGVGAYTLSGGTITTAVVAHRGITLGVNPNSSGTFTMTGGALNMTAATGGGGDAILQIGRYDQIGENGQSGAFSQSVGVASVGILSIGGIGSNAGTGGTQVLMLTGGTFAANQFPRLSAGNSNVATITISGSADVTLPAFPTARGTGATATVYFDGGVLRPSAASGSYMTGLTNAFLRSGGATFDVPSGRDITIGQALLADGTSPGGGLAKTGVGTLTLAGANSYSGTTSVSAGVLALGAANAIPNQSSLLVNGGGFNLAGFNDTVGTVTITSGSIFGSGTLTSATDYDLQAGSVLARLGGSAGVMKSGTGVLSLSGSNTFTGATSITGGRLQVDSTGSMNSTSGITINGGELRYNAATALTRPITFTAGTISGTGSIGTAVTAAAGDILSPGNSPGLQAYTAGLTWSGSGSYLWELNALSGTAGVNWDVISVSGGTFNLSGLTSESRFILDLTTLTGSNTAGGLDLPYDGGSYSFLIASYTSLSTPLGTAAGTDLTSLFDLRLANWAAPKPLPENVSVRINGAANGIELVVVPEPAALALGVLGAATVGLAIRRRCRRGRNIAVRSTVE